MNSEALLKQYVDTGLKIPEYQFHKLKSNLRGTYLRKRILAFEAGDIDISYEMDYFPEDIQFKIIEKDESFIEFVKKPSLKLQKKVVDNNPYMLRYIENPAEYIQKAALSGFVDYRSLKNYSLDELKKQALQTNSYAIKCIYNPSEEMQLYAVNIHPLLIEYIKNSTPKVQMFAIRRDPLLFRKISKPSIEVQRHMVDNAENAIPNNTDKLDITIQRRGVTRNPNFIIKINNPSEEIQMLAIQGNPTVIKYIEEPTDEVLKMAVESEPTIIRDIISPSEELQMIAVKKKTTGIYNIRGVAMDSVQLYVAKNDPETYSRYVESAVYHSQHYRDRVPSPSVLKYWENKKPLNENINRIKELL